MPSWPGNSARSASFVLSWGDDPYLEAFGGDVRTAAWSAGLEIAGSAAWDPDASGFRRLARRIARARADAVFIGGHLQPNGELWCATCAPCWAVRST